MHHLCTGPVHVSSLHAYMWRKNLLAWTATSFASLCAHPEQRPLLHHIPQLFPRSFTGLPSHALALHVAHLLHLCLPQMQSSFPSATYRRAGMPSSARWDAWCSATCCPASAASAWARFSRTRAGRGAWAALGRCAARGGGAARRAPGQLFWVTDDVLPDLHVALGVRADYDWQRRQHVSKDFMRR